jgi:hypothetical protein
VKKLWFNFIEELREFTKPKMLNFEVRNINLNNLNKRGENQMTESKLWGGNKTSYQDLGETRLIIKHSQPVNTEIPAGRTMHIESIYIENQAGERFRYPIRHLNGARAMAEHIAHGGNPYDEIGQYVVGLSEELSSLRKFKGYVSRTSGVSEAMGDITNRVVERIDEIKKEIGSLQKSSFYETFAEGFTKLESKEIPEDIVNDWVDRLTIKTFNEELKGVFPYIYKLVGEEINPVKEVDYEDFLNSTITQEEYESEEFDYIIPEELKFEKYLNTIIGEDGTIFSDNEEEQKVAIDKLNGLVQQELPVGSDGSNAIESLKEIINDDELNDIFKELADVSPESDVRPILKDYIKIKDEENGSDVLSKINFGDNAEPSEPATPPSPEPAAPAPMPTEPAPAAAAPAAPPATPAPVMADIHSGSGNKLASAIERAKKAGMQAEDTITVAGKEMTLADAIKHVGMQVEDFFGSGYEDSGDEVVEFVKSMFDEETGRFPKGETGVLLSVEKKFGESAVKKAHHVMNELGYMAESKRIRQLAGLSEAAPQMPQVKVPPVPKLPAQDGDQGDGSVVKPNPDGTKSYMGAFGTFIYDKTGKAIKYTSPNVSGFAQTVDLATQGTTSNYNQGPLSVQQSADASGKVTGSDTSYDLGVTKMRQQVDAAGNKTNTTTPVDLQDEGVGDDLAFGAGKVVGQVQKGATDAVNKLRQGASDLAANFKSGRASGMSDFHQGDIDSEINGQGGQPTNPNKDVPPRMDKTLPTTPNKNVPPRPGTKITPNQNGDFKESNDLTAILRIAGLR